ncbi:GntR family transcriptional regulator [Mycolicibacterium sp. 050158]|uniref:GntR family transcriptional regulator n=1 Tax=Mycolicibacterium sp. 050158 TaxID=3090602 RepID=UPI00299CE46A|nr:GntR family transcriptional regulator [Mycolicibacterium sp. 050158]MDX1891340.1 GntR family transcriptional regulator [Mycolicibacterium sp. 050158]
METHRDGTALVSTDAGVPLHRQLYLVLHDEIARGVLGPGDALPTEQSLCEQFGVSRITVRRALADLAEAGLIDRRHGVGSFVTERSATGRGAAEGSYVDTMRQVDFETEVDVIEHGIRSVPPAVGSLWDARRTALYVLRVRRERRTNEPLMLTEAWLPTDLADVITAAAMARAPLYRLLADAGVTLEHLEHEMTAEIASPRTAALLATSIGAPLMRVNRVAFAAAVPHHVLSITMSPSRSRIVLTQRSMDMEAGARLSIAHDVLRPNI